MTTGEDTHGCDYFTPVFLLPQLCNSTARKIIGAIQPDAEVRETLRPGYATNADSLTMAGHVVAIEFATVAAANNYWRA